MARRDDCEPYRNRAAPDWPGGRSPRTVKVRDRNAACEGVDPKGQLAQAQVRAMLIDAHQHFWRIGRNGHEWPTPDLTGLYRDFGPNELLEASQGLGLTGSIVVQSQPNELDTDWLLALVKNEPLVLGVVGWVDLSAPNAPSRLANLARQPKFKGVRPMLQSLPDPDWIARPALAPALDALEALELSLDALVYTRQLPAVLAVARQRPALRIVIDHGAKPPISSGDLETWASAMAAAAEVPQVHCKLSGLWTEAAPGAPGDVLAPYIDRLIQLFGPERLMWGSDWPVVNLAGDYAAWHDHVCRRLALVDTTVSRQVMGEVARRFYRIASAEDQ